MRCLIFGLLLCGALAWLLLVPTARALIAGPYIPDSFTLHLWHLNDSSAPAIDSVPNGIHLTSLTNGATVGNASFPGFGTALSTVDGGPNGLAPIAKDAALAALPLVIGTNDDVAVRYVDPQTGAFTYEAVVRIDFNQLAHFGATNAGGNGRSATMMLITGENDVESGRVFQFRLVPVGTAANTQPMLEFINVNKGVSIQSITAPIPTNGPDAILSNNWYHAAVTYSGSANTAANLKLYWTLLDANRTNANLIGAANMTSSLPQNVAMDFTIGNTGRATPNANFVGLIDEVRLSSVARASNGMMFWDGVVTPPPSNPPPAALTSAERYLESLLDFERHAETIWRDATGTSRPPDSGYFGDGGSAGNGGIRGSCGVAVAYAVLVRALPNDPKRAGRLEKIRKALNYAANTHITGTKTCVDNKQWGWTRDDWQTPLWTGSLGLACMLVENDLPAATVQDCQRVIASEATHRAGIAPPSGYIGDTKAEENAWDSNVLVLGAAWMNTHSNAPLWLTGAKKYLANSYTVANTNGDPLATWVTTTTLYPSFALENHGFYHPSYQMVAGMSLGDSLLMARLGNPAVAAELQPFAEHNVLNVWGHLQHMLLESGEFAYPSGLDWALHSYEQNSYIAWLATHFNDPLARAADAQLAKLVRYRQTVNGDGRFVGESEAKGFYREAVEARRTAIAWLHHAYADYPTGPSAVPGPDVAHFPDVKMITQRGSNGFVSISYGPKIMGLIQPPSVDLPTNTYLTTPKLNGIFGQGALGNPTSAQLVRLLTNANGFEAELNLQHGSKGSSAVYVNNTGDTIAIVEVPHPVAGVSASTAGSFTVGVENHPLTGGTRLLRWTGNSTIVTNRSGVTRLITNDWICVSDRYGIAAGPEGYFRYQAASTYNRLGAAEDSLQYQPADPFAPRYAVWFPGKNPAQIAEGAGSISWNVSTSNIVLTFPGLNGALQQIVATPPPPPPPYAPYPVVPESITASSWQPAYPPAHAIDGNSGTFWVSSGSQSGQGPTVANPEWLAFAFGRTVAVSGLILTPRINYGPKAIQVVIGSNVVFTGSLSNAAFSLTLHSPVLATNARIVITDSFDPAYPATPRNAQVVEVSFLERALPGTFGAWALRRFSEAQLADPAVSSAEADPEFDGSKNLFEFITGGDPWMADAESFALRAAQKAPGVFSLRFFERENLGGIVREILVSANLSEWSAVTPVQERVVGGAGEILIREVDFPMSNGPSFLRLNYRD